MYLSKRLSWYKQLPCCLTILVKKWNLLGFLLGKQKWWAMLLTLSAPNAVLSCLQTILIQVNQLVTSCLTWNQHCFVMLARSLMFIEINKTLLHVYLLSNWYIKVAIIQQICSWRFYNIHERLCKICLN